MSGDPERPIEKLLRDYAEGRRRQGPLSLHPATRRLLLDEARRRYHAQAQNPHARFPWPRAIGWAFGAAACLALVAAVFWPGRKTVGHEQTLARNIPPTAVSPANTAPPEKTPELALAPAAPSPALAPESPIPNVPGSFAYTSSLQNAPLPGASGTLADAHVAPSATFAGATPGLQSTDSTTQQPGAAGQAGPLTWGPIEDRSASNQLGKDLALAQATAKEPTQLMRAAAAPAVDGLASLASTAAAQTQNFIQTAPEPAALAFEADSPPASRVLASFRVEQAGQLLRIIDQDGSLYVGQWQPLLAAPVSNPPSALAGTRSFAPAKTSVSTFRSRTQAGSGGPARFFRVSGTNRSLGQPVVFTGRLLPLTNGIAGAVQSPTQWLDGRITGTVRVGRQKEFELKAAPAKP